MALSSARGRRKGTRGGPGIAAGPPQTWKRGQVNDHQDQDAWIARNAALARRALGNPTVRTELLGLLGSDDGGWRRERRLEAARRELEGWRPAGRCWRRMSMSLDVIFAYVVGVL